MWNYSFIFPNVLVLVILLCYYFARPRLPIHINRLYVAMLALDLLIIVSDVASSLADEHYQSFSTAALYVLNTLFFALFLLRLYAFFCYDAELLHLRSNRALMAAFAVPIVIFESIAISSFRTGAVFSIVNGAYQRGPLYGILYYCYMFYILAALALLLPYANRMRRHELTGYVCINLMLLAGTVIRRLFPQYLVMSTFSLSALLMIYLTFENPDLYMSDRGVAFNMRGFRTMLRELSRHRDTHILAFAIRNYNHERNIYGGTQIDQCISQITEFLKAAFPECVSFYLRGGRFALVGPERLNWDMVRARCSERFQAPWSIENASLYISVGFAEFKPQPGIENMERIIGNLSIALEMVGRPEVGTPGSMMIDAESMHQLDEQTDILYTLEQAVKNGEVEVFLQPVYSSSTRTMVAAEALARIRDAHGRIIPPSLFIPIAEKNGYIDRLGEIVFEKTCAFIQDYDMSTLNLSWVNVNLSPIQCLQRDLARRLTDILSRYSVPAEKIHLEITEQSIIDYSLLEQQVAGLQNRGFQFVLDDYGSGYSNLTRVKHYPFVNIKLDMEVVWDYFRDRDSLIPTIVEGFRKMGLSITAEGIETREMADALTLIGCDYLQGFLFDRPLPIDEFVRKYGKK